jgi:hypothetical protein
MDEMMWYCIGRLSNIVAVEGMMWFCSCLRLEEKMLCSEAVRKKFFAKLQSQKSALKDENVFCKHVFDTVAVLHSNRNRIFNHVNKSASYIVISTRILV